MTKPSEAAATWWLGIDVGGTFTDFVAVNRDTGETREHKVLTTADAQEIGVLQAVLESGRELPPMTIGGEKGAACYWLKHPEWKTTPPFKAVLGNGYENQQKAGFA